MSTKGVKTAHPEGATARKVEVPEGVEVPAGKVRAALFELVSNLQPPFTCFYKNF